MKKRLKLKWLAIKIEWNWWFILKYRNRGNRLVDRGIPFTSKKLLQLGTHITQRWIKSMEYEKKYEVILFYLALKELAYKKEAKVAAKKLQANSSI